MLLILVKNSKKFEGSRKPSKKFPQYVKAGIYLSSNEKDQAKDIYKEIISSKNNFYSILALNNIIENDLIKNSNEILELFKFIEKIKIEKDQKNLVKLKELNDFTFQTYRSQKNFIADMKKTIKNFNAIFSKK